MNRGRFQGVTQIVRFNWPFYAIATILVIATAAIATRLTGAARIVIVIAAAIAAYWMIASLVASYWIYDLSPLRDWKWIREALTAPPPATWLNLHAGIDESTPDVRALFPDSTGRSLDFFDAEVMTEPSIRRARRLAHNMEPSEAVDFRRLPAGDGSQQAAFLLLSAHELRRHDDRVALLREAHRVIAPGGRAIVAEHLRDPANFLAFGPGFLHFHSRRTWLRAFADAGVVVESSFRITPFIAVFVLRRSS